MTRRPRREWKSFLWPSRWLVRWRRRSERIATCPSGEPVSPDLVAYSEMTACLRSGVIDIGIPFASRVEDTHRAKSGAVDLGKGDDASAAHGVDRVARVEGGPAGAQR